PHVSSGVRSAGCNLIATRVFGMSETIAITGKSVKLLKGHYTSILRPRATRPRGARARGYHLQACSRGDPHTHGSGSAQASAMELVRKRPSLQ
ncbi:MAG: hypothetical protein ACREYE_14050, partial [Gammaproteobacteria bacterium]